MITVEALVRSLSVALRLIGSNDLPAVIEGELGHGLDSLSRSFDRLDGNRTRRLPNDLFVKLRNGILRSLRPRLART